MLYDKNYTQNDQVSKFKDEEFFYRYFYIVILKDIKIL